MIKVYIPFGYGFYTRVKTLAYRMSFFIITILPSFYITLFMGNGLSWGGVVKYLIAFLSMYSMYEIGYIYNDVYTTKAEQNPTVRLGIQAFEYVQNNYLKLICSRVIVISICTIYLVNQNVNASAWIGYMTVLYIGYAIHNSTRSKINAFSMFIIVAMKYVIPSFISVPQEHYLDYVILIIVMMPLPRMIEYGSKSSCKLFGVKNYPKFRVYYYSLCIVIEILLSEFTKKMIWHIPILVVLLLYRIFTYIVEHKSGNYFMNKEVSKH